MEMKMTSEALDPAMLAVLKALLNLLVFKLEATKQNLEPALHSLSSHFFPTLLPKGTVTSSSTITSRLTDTKFPQRSDSFSEREYVPGSGRYHPT